MWRRRQWVSLLNLIDRLPRNSHFQAALANDEEYAEQVAAVEEEHGPEVASEWRPPMQTFSAEVEAMILVANKLESLITLVESVAGGKSKPKYVKGPKTAIEEAMERKYVERRQRQHKSLVARLLPPGRESAEPSETSGTIDKNP